MKLINLIRVPYKEEKYRTANEKINGNLEKVFGTPITQVKDEFT